MGDKGAFWKKAFSGPEVATRAVLERPPRWVLGGGWRVLRCGWWVVGGWWFVAGGWRVVGCGWCGVGGWYVVAGGWWLVGTTHGLFLSRKGEGVAARIACP